MHALDTSPVITKAVTAAVLSVVSDMIAQTLINSSHGYNLRSLFNQFVIGLFIRGPWVHYWYLLLDKMFAALGFAGKHADDWTAVVGKVLIDQLTFGPFFHFIYFVAIGILDGRDADSIYKHVQRDYLRTLLMNYTVWPLVNIINFKFVPPNLRVLFGNVIAIAWTTAFILATSV